MNSLRSWNSRGAPAISTGSGSFSASHRKLPRAPILVGKLDSIADRQAGVLRVRAIHQDVPFTKAMTEAIGREIEDLARWLALDLALLRPESAAFLPRPAQGVRQGHLVRCPAGHPDQVGAGHDGGRWRYVHTDHEGNAYAFHGVFHGDPSPEAIVQTFEFDGAPGHVKLDTTTLEQRGGKTLVRAVSAFPSVEDRDAMIASGMERGVHDSAEHLEELLARLQTR